MACIPTIYYFFWVRYHPNKVYSQKKLQLETKYRPLLPSPPNHTLYIPLTVGPPPLYWLGIGWWCSSPPVLAPLSSVFVFFHSHTISAVTNQFCFILLCVFVLFFHAFPAVFVISFGLAFLSFTQFLLLTLPVVPCFFSSYFFILVFTPIFLYKRIWVFVGQIMLTGSKRSWAQFVFICRSHSARELYSATKLYSAANRFPLHLFLQTSLALWSSWWAFGPCFSLGFPSYRLLGTDQKIGINTWLLKTTTSRVPKERRGGRRQKMRSYKGWEEIKKRIYICVCVCVCGVCVEREQIICKKNRKIIQSDAGVGQLKFVKIKSKGFSQNLANGVANVNI